MYDERGAGISDHLAAECRIEGCISHPKHNNSKPAANPLADHPAVTGYRAVGIDTDDLVSFIESFASLRASRVRGVGADQYALAKGQKFEAFTVDDTIRELVEELADASNYIDFLAIKLLNLQHIIDEVLPNCD